MGGRSHMALDGFRTLLIVTAVACSSTWAPGTMQVEVSPNGEFSGMHTVSSHDEWSDELYPGTASKPHQVLVRAEDSASVTAARRHKRSPTSRAAAVLAAAGGGLLAAAQGILQDDPYNGLSTSLLTTSVPFNVEVDASPADARRAEEDEDVIDVDEDGAEDVQRGHAAMQLNSVESYSDMAPWYLRDDDGERAFRDALASADRS